MIKQRADVVVISPVSHAWYGCIEKKKLRFGKKTVAFAMTNSSKSFSKSAVLLSVNTIRSIFLLPMKDKINIGRA